MMKKKWISRKLWGAGVGFSILCLWAGLTCAEKVPTAGSLLPKFQLKTPSGKEERIYLGIGNTEKFTLQQIPAQLLLIEILGVYCPLCHTQGPHFNQLFHRIQKDSLLNKKIKMLAIAIGANPTEISYIRQELQIPFPIVRDPNFEIHKLLGEPRTPTTLIVGKDGKVFFIHVGVIEDTNGLYTRIQNLTQ